MPQEFSRARRVGEQIKRDLAELIRSESDDKRMAMVSITIIDVSRDFSHAKVYVTLLGAAEERDEVIAELNRLAPVLRGHLGRRMRIRTVPSLKFVYDHIPEKGAELSDLISRAVQADASKQRQSDD